jgi:DNA repair ATPase RecN
LQINSLHQVKSKDFPKKLWQQCQKAISKGDRELKSIEYEIRTMKDVEEKAFWKANIAEMDYRFVDAKHRFIDMQNKAELFPSSSSEQHCTNNTWSNDDYLSRAEKTYDAIDDSLGNIMSLINDTDDLASASREQLSGQTEQIKSITVTVNRIDDKLVESGHLIRKFNKKRLGIKYVLRKVKKIPWNVSSKLQQICRASR